LKEKDEEEDDVDVTTIQPVQAFLSRLVIKYENEKPSYGNFNKNYHRSHFF